MLGVKYLIRPVGIIMQIFLLAIIPFSHLVTSKQLVYGTVTGQVVEPVEKVLTGSKVTITNEDDGKIHSTLTNDDGFYRITYLPPGRYRVSASLSGYSEGTQTCIIPLGEITYLRLPNITLYPVNKPQPTTTATQNLAPESVVNTTDARRSGNYDDKWLLSLPLGGTTDMRTFDELALLTPGVASPPYTHGVRGPGVGFGIGTSGQFAVNGLRSRSNNFSIDGSDNNDPDVGVRRQGFLALVPQPVESVKEFQIATLLWDAEIGRNFGGQVNAVSRGGGNGFHGQAYGFFTDSRLNARNFFDLEGGPSGGKEPFTRTQAGGVIGGPIKQDKIHFFGSFEHLQVNQSVEQNFSTPTLFERSFVNYLGGILNPKPSAFSVLHPFPAAQPGLFYNPGSGLTPLGRNVLSLYPLPNNPQGIFGENTYTEVLPADGDGQIFSLKITGQINSRSSLAVRYNFTNDERVLPSVNQAIRSTINSKTGTQDLSVIYDTSLAQNLYNLARFSFGRTNLRFPEHPNGPLFMNAGSNVTVGNSIFSSQTGFIGEVIIEPFSPVGVDTYTFPQSRVNNLFQYADSVALTEGAHALKFGVDIRRIQLNSRQDRLYRPLVVYGNGVLQTGNFVVTGPSDPPPGRFVADGKQFILPGVALASVGVPSSIFQTITFGTPDSTLGLRFTEYNVFFNDNWRINPRFTLDYGVRYEYNSVPHEANNRIEDALALKGISDAAPSRINTADRLQGFNAAVEAYRQALGGRTRIYDPDRNNVGFHVGFSWSPLAGKTLAIRGGYGLYYDTILGAVVSQSRNVFPTEIPVNADPGFLGFNVFNLNNLSFVQTGNPPINLIQRNPDGSLSQGNQFGGSPDQFAGLIGQLFLQNQSGGLAFTLPAKNLPSPYAQHWHLSIEKEVGNGYLLSAAYVGTKGTKLTRLTTPNLGPNLTPFIPLGLAIKAGNATINLPSPSIVSDSAEFKLRQRPLANLGAIQVFENTASSNYHALQLEARKSYSRRYTFSIAYTWSHAIDDVSDVFPIAGAPFLPQDSFNLRAERGNANFDVRHRLTSSLIWDLPGLPDSIKSLGAVLNHWQLATIFQIHSGQPFTLNIPVDANLDGNFTDRPSTTDGLVFLHSHGPQRVALDPGKTLQDFFVLGENGVVGRNTVRSDSFINLDLALNKDFRFTDRQSLQFRAEFFNLCNRANFGIPVRVIGSPGFGSATDTVNPARIIQFALKYRF